MGSFKYSPPNIISVIKSRRKRCMRHAAHKEEIINAYRILVRTS
jgi:hypothetical protein